MPIPVDQATFAQLVARLEAQLPPWLGSMTNLQNLVSIIATAGGRWWLTKAELDADVATAEGTPSVVYADPDDALNGIYVKTAPALSAGWTPTGYIFGSTVPVALLDPDVFAVFQAPLEADVTQIIGRSADPIDGSAVADAMYLSAEPVTHPGPLAEVKVFIKVAGDLKIARYVVTEVAGDFFIQQQEVATITVATTGLHTFTNIDFGIIDFLAGDLVGMSGNGMFTASAAQPVDPPGWRQINAALTDVRPMPALQTAIRLEFQFSILQHYQVVNGPDFLDVLALGAATDVRVTTLEAKADLLDVDVIQAIGRDANPVNSDPVADAFYIWADPVAYDGPLVNFEVWVEAVGQLKLAKYTKSGTTVTRTGFILLDPPATGLAVFPEADLQGFTVEAGDYLALYGNGLFVASSIPADGAGWWQVNPIPDIRTVGAPITTHRLEARFEVRQKYQAANGQAILDLQAEQKGLQAQIDEVGVGVQDGTTVACPAWITLDPLKFEAPLRGGMVGQSVKRYQGERCLAHLATVADIYNGAALGHTNVAADRPFCGLTNARLTVTGTGSNVIPTAPLAPNAVPTDVQGGLIGFEYKTVSNVGLGFDRWWLELHSAGSTPAAPSGNYHRIPIGSNSWLKSRLTSRDGVGSNQTDAIPVSMFEVVGAGADLSAVTWARYMSRAANGQTVAIEYGNISFLPNLLANSKAKLILGLDDGYIEQISTFLPKARKRGFRCVWYTSPPAISVDVSNSYNNHNHLIQLQDRGHQMASQAWDDEGLAAFSAKTHNQQVGWYGELRNWHGALGFTGGDDCSYFSTVDSTYLPAREAMRKHFRTAREYLGGNASGPPLTFPETYPFGDAMKQKALNAGFDTTAANGARLIAAVQQAIDNKCPIELVWHKEFATNANILNGIDQVMDFADNNRAVLDDCTKEDLHNYANRGSLIAV